MAIKNYSKREINIRELYTGEANCEEIGDPIFFASKDNWELTVAARKICSSCPLIIKCRDYAIQNYVQGVWGGTTEPERQKMRSQLGVWPKSVVLDMLA